MPEVAAPPTAPMEAFLVIAMDIKDDAWLAPYFDTVPDLLAEYGAVWVAASRHITRVEGEKPGPVPDRVAILRFPSRAALDSFFADPRYAPFRAMRLAGSDADLFAFESKSEAG
ncbi:DUF1330 domain-containing protein [Novosphingobium terrae]|uniref:DUF1330 domain-containing protein n=1 Tax=Novosphingobium terrae TaxID=2726189 RepID=UPI00197D8507|nr:DUF1330 domain-containing protein [Novosphingobium terrae]